MKPFQRIAVAGALFGASMLAGSSLSQPVRRPGLWDMSVQTMGQTMHMQMCVGAEKPGDAQAFAPSGPGGRSHGGDCERAPAVTPTPGGLTYHVVCHPSPQMTLDSTGTVTGDFRNTYTVRTVTRMTPAMQGMPSMESTVSARFMGACPAGMAPGDRSVNGYVMHGRP